MFISQDCVHGDHELCTNNNYECNCKCHWDDDDYDDGDVIDDDSEYGIKDE